MSRTTYKVVRYIMFAAGLAVLAVPALAMPLHAPVPSTAAVTPARAAAVSTETFVQIVAISSMFEIQSSQLALQKAGDDQIKQFAQMMITDHQKAADELKAVAQQKNLQLPQELDRRHASILRRLEGRSGGAFDKTYASAQLKGHRDAVGLFRSYARDGSDPELKQWAQTTLPVLEEHLRRAETIQDIE
jgi:putative membrane protein